MLTARTNSAPRAAGIVLGLALLCLASAPMRSARAQYDGGGNCPILGMQTAITARLNISMDQIIYNRIRSTLDLFGLGCLTQLVNLGGLSIFNIIFNLNLDSICQVILRNLRSSSAQPSSILPGKDQGFFTHLASTLDDKTSAPTAATHAEAP